MSFARPVWALAAGLFLAIPARAQDIGPMDPAPPGMGMGAFPPGEPPFAPPEAHEAPPCTCPARPGLFGWRRRHAQCKRHLQDKVLGYPEEFNEWPLGRALYAHGRTQVGNAEVSRLIFNDYDFVQETSELNYRGRDKLAVITAQLPATFAPVIIERTPWAPGLDESRRLTILSQMATGPFPIPAERVLVGPPIARGLLGQEAWITNRNRLGQIGSGGLGGSVSAGFDAGGLSGAAVAPGAVGGGTTP